MCKQGLRPSICVTNHHCPALRHVANQLFLPNAIHPNKPPTCPAPQVRLVLAGAVGALPTNRLAELTDVLYAVLKVRLVAG